VWHSINRRRLPIQATRRHTRRHTQYSEKDIGSIMMWIRRFRRPCLIAKPKNKSSRACTTPFCYAPLTAQAQLASVLSLPYSSLLILVPLAGPGLPPSLAGHAATTNFASHRPALSSSYALLSGCSLLNASICSVLSSDTAAAPCLSIIASEAEARAPMPPPPLPSETAQRHYCRSPPQCPFCRRPNPPSGQSSPPQRRAPPAATTHKSI
jgi:hypothetical protein